MDEFSQLKVQAAPADGAFYAFINARGDDVEVAEHWLNKARVAVTPGTAFYAPGWIRISYATALPRLKDAMNRIKSVWNQAPDPRRSGSWGL
jgi:aspartate aminotransferase